VFLLVLSPQGFFGFEKENKKGKRKQRN